MATEIVIYNQPGDDDPAMKFNVRYDPEVAPRMGDDEGRPNLTIEYRLPPPDGRVFTQRCQGIHMGRTVTGVQEPPDDDYITASFGSFVQRHYIGDLVFKAEWKNRKNGQTELFEKVFPAGIPLNRSTTVPVDVKEVRLSQQLAAPLSPEEEPTPTGNWSTDHTSPEGRGRLVADILAHVDGNLRAGFGRFWRLADEIHCCKDGQALRDIDLGRLTTEQEVEECWAQHVAELLTGTPYWGPGAGMRAPAAPDGMPNWAGAGHRRDAWVMRQYAREDNPMYPLMFTCQQLTSMCLIFRGHESLAQYPLDSHGVHVGELPGAQDITSASADWLEWTSEGNGWVRVSQPLGSRRLKPATCFYFLIDRPPDSGDTPHVGMVLRILRSRQRVQMMDTGAWIFDHTGPFAMAAGLSGGYNFDTPYTGLLEKRASGTSVTRLTGIKVPPPSVGLRGAIAKMRRARPLGIARLVVALRAAGAITEQRTLWVSQLTPMYRGDDSYSIARLLGSLRGCPHREHLDVRWQVRAPYRGETLRATAQRSREWWRPAAGYSPQLTAVIEVGVQADGRPVITDRRTQSHEVSFPSFLESFNSSDFSSHVAAEVSAGGSSYANWADVSPHRDQISWYFSGEAQ